MKYIIPIPYIIIGLLASTPITNAVAQEVSEEEETIVLSPFEVSSDRSLGYSEQTSLAGNRLRTDLRDIGSAVSVVNKEFMDDVGVQDNASLLQYVTNSEVGSVRGNFAGVGNGAALVEDTIQPNNNTRVRGLSRADNTRDYFRTDISWDSYNVDRVDLQRGPNSILFGQGSPAGIINAGLKGAVFRNVSEVEFRFGSYGTARAVADFNREIIEDELAVRVIALYDHEKYQQDPAFNRDGRLYAAIRYEPKALAKNGNRTIIKANYETGGITSNNPRTLPPEDAITRWFTELGQATYNGFAAFDHLSGRPNHGQFRRNIAATGAPNPAFVPGIATYGTPSPRSAPAVFTSGGGQDARIVDIVQNLSQSVNGGSIYVDNGWASLRGTTDWAADSGAPYAAAGLWKNDVITNPDLLDFYNQLIDGDTKREYQDFDVVNANLSQTFFEDKLGLSLEYNHEEFESRRQGALGYAPMLQIDQMAVYSDGSPDLGLVEGGEPFSDGTPNPNAGKPFLSSANNANTKYAATRETKRATAFLSHDFADASDSWFRRFLGSHTITGLWSDETLEGDRREWQRYGIFDDVYYSTMQPQVQRFNHGSARPVQILHLGDSLIGSSMSNASIPNVRGMPIVTTGSLNYFNNTWKHPLDPSEAGYVDPTAPWQNGFYLPGDTAVESTQASNPTNYIGWDTIPLNIVDANVSSANRDMLTTRATLTDSSNEALAAIWQAKWLNDSIVTTVGWRRDKANSGAFETSPDEVQEGPATNYGVIDLSPGNYRIAPENRNDEITVESESYSVVVHLTDLPYLKKLTEKWPVSVSAYYNKSSNFKPDASRVDIYGEAQPLPSGETIDRGIRLATKDGRYSLRINRYETSNFNANSTEIRAFSIGSWFAHQQNYANWYDYNIASGSLNNADTAPRGADTDVFIDSGNVASFNAQRYNYHHFPNNPDGTPRTFSPDTRFFQTRFAVDPVIERAILANVRAFQRSIDPRFYSAWKIDTFGDFGVPAGQVSYAVPVGFTIVEDSISTGTEIELAAEPIQNLRLAFNAAKTDAIRTNIGGPAINEFMEYVNSNLGIADDWDLDKGWNSSAVGRQQFFWGAPGNLRAGASWFNGQGIGAAPGSEWRLAQLVENTAVAELREWRANLVANYRFSEGNLRGFNVGTAIRYQSDITLTYKATGNPNDPLDAGYDFDDPIKGPAETNVDLWVGYRHRLFDKVDWRVQINVYNIFNGGDNLIPITAQPTGQYAAYRIAPTRSFMLSNTFSF